MLPKAKHLFPAHFVVRISFLTPRSSIVCHIIFTYVNYKEITRLVLFSTTNRYIYRYVSFSGGRTGCVHVTSQHSKEPVV